jgi:hypothetical protein
MLGHDLFNDDEEGSGTVFRDVIMLALAGFVAIVLLLLPHINPRAQAAKSDSNPPGNVIVEMRWPDPLDTDVDLWVEAPGDRPVGYSNKGGDYFNLLRDDLGKLGDATELNYEVSYSRGIPEGEYTVNAHLYRNTSKVYPVPVTVVVSVKRSPQESAQQILTTTLNLHRDGEEATAFRFTLDKWGKVVAGSVHDLPRPLRAAKKG